MNFKTAEEEEAYLMVLREKGYKTNSKDRSPGQLEFNRLYERCKKRRNRLGMEPLFRAKRMPMTDFAGIPAKAPPKQQSKPVIMPKSTGIPKPIPKRYIKPSSSSSDDDGPSSSNSYETSSSIEEEEPIIPAKPKAYTKPFIVDATGLDFRKLHAYRKNVVPENLTPPKPTIPGEIPNLDELDIETLEFEPIFSTD